MVLKLESMILFTQRETTSGFTLIELMIAIAIMAIIAAVAIPAYITFAIKGHASELLHTASSVEAAVVEVIQENGITSGTLTNFSGQFANLNTTLAVATTANLLSLTIQSGGANNGTIYAVGTAATGNSAIKLTPTINADGSVSWICNACSSGPGNKYLPGTCGTTTTCP